MRHELPGLARAVLIAGPTASGKSALALALAQRHGGVVINADSMQVYRDLHVITARPSPQEQAQAPHALYGHVDAADNYSTGRWLSDARAALEDAERAGRLPIFVGGTGLYFKTLTSGIAAVPPVPSDIRKAFRARLDEEGIAPLRTELETRDPASAQRIMPRDTSRTLRALEVVEATGRTLSDWHAEGTPPLVDPECAVKIFLAPERSVSLARIAERFDAMLAAGALGEVRALDARELDARLPAMKAHGVPWLRAHLRGEITLEQAAEGAKMDTRRYAKRQATWFRNQMPGWLAVPPQEAETAIQTALTALEARPV